METRTMLPRSLIPVFGAAALLICGAHANADTAQSKTHLGGKVSGLVSLTTTSSIAPGTTAQLSRVVATSQGSVAPLVIPHGAVLVVTDVTLESFGPGDAFIEICEAGPCSVVPLRIGTTDRFTALHLTSGVPFRAAPDVSNFLGSDSSVLVTAHGYFAMDR